MKPRTLALEMAIAAAGLAGIAAISSAADSYTATPIPNLPGGIGTIGLGVNDNGWVVGQAGDQFAQPVAFVYHDGVTEPLPPLAGGWDSRASSINSNNVIVGECRNDQGVFRPVMWTQDHDGVWEITDLGTFAPENAGFGVATRINDAGHIVGYCTAASGTAYHGFLWDNGLKTDVGTLFYSGNNAYSQALGVSPTGDVVGFAYGVLQGPEHGLYLPLGARDAEDITPAAPFALAQWHAATSDGKLGGYIASSSHTGGAFRPTIHAGHDGYVIIPLIEGVGEGYGYDLTDSGVFVGTMFQLDVDPSLSVFLAFKHEADTTVDLNTVTTDLPGIMIEARDASESGMIVGTSEGPSGPVAVLLVPDGAECAADFDRNGTHEVADIFAFLSAWFAQDPQADVDGIPGIGVPDIFSFLSLWFAGC